MKPARPKRKAIPWKMKIDALLSYGGFTCPECFAVIHPGEHIEWDHRQALIHDGPHEYQNIKPIHFSCHKLKTARDVKANAKVKRIAKGGKKRRGPKMKSAAFRKAKRDPNWKPRVRQIDRGE